MDEVPDSEAVSTQAYCRRAASVAADASRLFLNCSSYQIPHILAILSNFAHLCALRYETSKLRMPNYPKLTPKVARLARSQRGLRRKPPFFLAELHNCCRPR